LVLAILSQTVPAQERARFQVNVGDPKQFDRDLSEMIEGKKRCSPEQLADPGLFGQCTYSAPYKAEYEARQANFETEDWFRWTTVDQVDSGKRVVESIRESFAQNSSHCSRGNCFFVTSGFDPNQPSIKVFELCRIYGTKMDLGAPSCASVLLEDGGKEWISVAVVRQGLEPLAPPSMNNFPIVVAAKVPTAKALGKLPAVDKILDAVSTALSEPILSLTLVPTPISLSVVGSCIGRTSKVIPPFRERTTVEIEAVQDERDGIAYIGLWPRVALYVNRQATDNASDWHEPSDSQKQAYENEVLAAVKRRLVGICVDSDWAMGGRVLTCGRDLHF
jgi:hypothetical protein